MENNKHLVRVGHEFAAAMSDDTPIITIAKMVAELASALDVQTARSEALAAENAALKHAMSVTLEHVSVMDTGQAGVAAMIINDALHNSETPATDAFLAEIRKQGVIEFAAAMAAIHAECQAGGYFDRQVKVYAKAQELAESYLKQRCGEKTA